MAPTQMAPQSPHGTYTDVAPVASRTGRGAGSDTGGAPIACRTGRGAGSDTADFDIVPKKL